MTVCKFKSLLPHSTALEKQIEQEAHAKYCRNNPDVIKQLNDPWTCPVEFLPWLAYSLSVDVWRDTWPEATQRAICANSIEAHIHKGTRGGLEDILSALGVRLEIVEWFEMQPQGEPGTVDLTLWVSENINPDAAVLVGSELISDLNKIIATNKRASIHHTLTLAIEMTTGVQVGYSVEQAATLTRADAIHSKTKLKASTGAQVGYSVEQSATLTRADAIHTKTQLNSNTGFKIGFSAGEMVTITHMEITL